MMENGKYPVMTTEWESSNVRDMYFAGVIMGAKDQRKYFSSFISGFRYTVRFLSQVLNEKYHDHMLAHFKVREDARALSDCLIERASKASSLVLQAGFIADVAVANGTGEMTYFHDVTLEYAREKLFNHGDCYVLTMEYGDFSGHDPLCIARDPNPDAAEDDLYVHPIVRHYRNGNQVAEYHVPENLENDWTDFQFTRRLFDRDEEGLFRMYREKLARFLRGEGIPDTL